MCDKLPNTGISLKKPFDADFSGKKRQRFDRREMPPTHKTAYDFFRGGKIIWHNFWAEKVLPVR